MYTRKLTVDDIAQYAEVSSSAYIHKASETEFDESSDIFGTFTDDGILISQIESTIRKCRYGDSTILFAAVGGVASRPEYRRLGGVRATFEAVHKNACEKGAVISILYPFSIAYYRKFGYEPVMPCYRADCPFKAFEDIERFTGVKLLTESSIDAVKKIYNTVAEQSNLMFIRDDKKYFCCNPYEENLFTYYIDNGASSGYVTLEPDRKLRTINVNEICFTDRTALTQLCGFLRTYDGNYDRVVFQKLPVTTPLFSVIACEDKLVSRTAFSGGSAKILNIEKLLSLNSYPSKSGSFSVKITDKTSPDNNGIYTVKYGDNACSVLKSEAGDFDISLDELAASKIMLAKEGLSPYALSFLPGAEIKSDCTDLLRAFTGSTTQFYDGF